MGLLAPWFLAGLAALSVPVFVHLLRRYTIPPRPFSSLMFFEQGKQSSTRHRRLRYLLLFALRAALLLLLVLAFAQPFVRRAGAGANSRLLLVVVDNSFSMRTGSRLEQAKQGALGVLASKSPSRRAQVAVLGSELQLLTQPDQDSKTLRAAVRGIQPSDSRGNFGQLARGVRALEQSTRLPIELDLFSDMQQSGATANLADMALPANVSLVLHPIPKGAGQSSIPNWTVESIDAPSQVSGPQEANQAPVRAVIAGYGTPAATRTVSLVVNGKTAATRKVAVPANGRASVEFPSLDVPYGFSRCAVKIDSADAFPSDDESIFAVRRSDPERVLFVHQPGDTRSPLYFGDALAAAAHTTFVLQPVSAGQTADVSPAKYAFVVLSDTVALPSIFENALLQYVRGGGGVLITTGTSAAHHARIPLWGGEALGARDYTANGGYTTVGEVDLTDPAIAPEGGDDAAGSAAMNTSKGKETAGWSDLKFYYAAPVDASQSRVVVRLADGTPLLLDKQIGEGHVLLFASGFDNLTNDLPLHPLFVPFVDRVAHYLSGTERLNGSRIVDSFVQLRANASPNSQAAGVQVIDPEGRRPLSLSEAKSVQSYQLTRAGFYQIRFANGKDALIGVNPDRRESDLQPMSADMLKLWSANSNSQAAQTEAALASQGKNNRRSLWWYVMIGVLVVAVAESVLASRYLGTLREEA